MTKMTCALNSNKSNVRIVQRGQLKPLVCKKLKRCKESLQEIITTKFLKHQPGVITLEHVVELPHEYLMYLEHGGINLFDHINNYNSTKELSEIEARSIVKKCMQCIISCHKYNIVHGDVKPQNFVLDEQGVKVIDFGCAKHLAHKNEIVQTHQGTPYFMAPEILRSEIGLKSDAWSMGVMTYWLIHNGTYPFEGNTPVEVFRSILLDNTQYDKENYSQNCYDFMNLLLTKNYMYRMSVFDSLQHPWLL